MIGLIVTACGTATGGSPEASAIAEIGEGEGELNLVIWAGYAENGETDAAFDWVTPFEEETGCDVNATNMTRLEQRRVAHAVAASTTASRPPVTPRPG